MDIDDLTQIIAGGLATRAELDWVEVHTADGFEPVIHIGADGQRFVLCIAEREVQVYKTAPNRK
jgi:hypothetical protein